MTSQFKQAEGILEAMESKGVVLQRLPTIDIQTTLTYVELSDFIDAQIYDICRTCPEIFLGDSAASVSPGVLKCYLYIIALYHFNTAGIMVNTTGTQYPSAAGKAVPRAFLAWLQYIGKYKEGDVLGVAKYVTPAAVAVQGNEQMTIGTPVESNMSLSTFIGLNRLTLAATFGEPLLQGSIANPQTVIAAWTASADGVSDTLVKCGYPCNPMWDHPPTVPDGSFFAFPNTNTDAISTPYTMFASPFNKWNEEIAALYYTTSSITTGQVSIPSATRMGVMQNEWPKLGSDASGYEDSYFARKQMFAFIMRNNEYEPGASTRQLRRYHGTNLSTFRICPIQIQSAPYAEAVAMAIMQMFNQNTVSTATFDYVAAQVAMVLHMAAFLRRYQANAIGLHNNPASPQTHFLNSNASQVNVLSPIAQLLAELGPIVRSRQLHLPLLANSMSDVQGGAWYQWGLNPVVNPNLPWATMITGASTLPVFFWLTNGNTGQQMGTGTFTAATTGYPSQTGHIFTPWYVLGQMYQYMQNLISRGTNYGLGDMLYPVTQSPWGGLSQLCRSNALALASVWNGNSAGQFGGSIIIQRWPLDSLYTNVPIVGEEIALAAIARWGSPLNPTNALTVAKYSKRLDLMSGDDHLERYSSETLGTGGPFLDNLGEAYRTRHIHGRNDGVVGSNDNTAACLWDAISPLLGQIAGYIQPIGAEVARFGCNYIPIVGPLISSACAGGASALLAHAADIAKVTSNRTDTKTVKGQLAELAKSVKIQRRVAMGELPEERGKAKLTKVRAGSDIAEIAGVEDLVRNTVRGYLKSVAPKVVAKPKPKPKPAGYYPSASVKAKLNGKPKAKAKPAGYYPSSRVKARLSGKK